MAHAKLLYLAYGTTILGMLGHYTWDAGSLYPGNGITVFDLSSKKVYDLMCDR